MTEGISKERLIEYRSLRLDSEELLDRIIDECTELDPWLPIENAPKDRRILLSDSEKGIGIGLWHEGYWISSMVVMYNATHYKFLPEDPK